MNQQFLVRHSEQHTRFPSIPIAAGMHSPPHCKNPNIGKESDFIKNMKRAKSIMISHKKRKQKIVMKSFFMSPPSKNPKPLSVSRPSIKHRNRTQLQVEQINLSVLTKCIKKFSSSFKCDSNQEDPFKISKTERHQDLGSFRSLTNPEQCTVQTLEIPSPTKKYGIRRHRQMDGLQFKTKKQSIGAAKNQTCGWKLARWEFEQDKR